MLGKIIKDWSKVDFGTVEGRAKLQGAFQYFVSAMDTVPELKTAYQAFTTSGDFPSQTLDIIEKFHAVDDFDEGWRLIFDVRDYTGTKKSGFRILDVQSGLTFNLIKTGEKVKIKKISGSDETINFDLYGGALGWDKVWIADEEYWLMEDTALEFRNSEYKARAQAFYDLIDAIPAGQNLAWQSSPDTLVAGTQGYLVSRDVATINKACENIIVDLKDANLGVNANSKFFLLYPIQLKSRIMRALDYLKQASSNSTKGVDYNIQPIATAMTSASDKYYVGIPGKKMKAGIRQNLTLSSFENVLAHTEGIAGFSRYAGVIGEVDQAQRCSVA